MVTDGKNSFVKTTGCNSEDINHRANSRKRYRNDLKNRFRTKYLGPLRQYANKDKYSRHLQIGDIVLLEENNKRRMQLAFSKNN